MARILTNAEVEERRKRDQIKTDRFIRVLSTLTLILSLLSLIIGMIALLR